MNARISKSERRDIVTLTTQENYNSIELGKMYGVSGARIRQILTEEKVIFRVGRHLTKKRNNCLHCGSLTANVKFCDKKCWVAYYKVNRQPKEEKLRRGLQRARAWRRKIEQKHPGILSEAQRRRLSGETGVSVRDIISA